MNLSVTISRRAFLALQEAASRNQSTPEALASEVVQQQGISYANIYRIGVMTSAAFVRRIYANEYAAILAAAEQNAQVAELVAELLESPYVALDDPRLAPGLELLVAGGLLAPERVAQLLDFGLPERPPTATALGQEWTSPTGTLYRVAQATGEDGQFLPDDPQTPPRESLRWVVVEP
jgi:hypothetical protein